MKRCQTMTLLMAAALWAGFGAACSDDDSGNDDLDGGVDSGTTVDAGPGPDGGGTPDAAPDSGVGPQPDPSCPALPATTGNVVNVATVSELETAVNSAQPGDAILLADGHYALDGVYLWLNTDDVELRSASGDREAVVLDGNYQTTEIITVVGSNVTVADLSIRRAFTHAIHVVSSGEDTIGTVLYNLHVVDSREQAIKINPNSPATYPDDGLIACSTLELTDTGRPHVNPYATGCYTGGVDGHEARGWTIRDNTIRGFWCDTGISEHAIHCWRGCRDTVVERNRLIDNARGVGFGMATSGDARTYSDDPCPGVTGYVGHYGGVVRNNFIYAGNAGLLNSPDGFDSGISFWSACNARAYHNTIVSTGGCFASIEWRFENSTGVEIANNIATHALMERNAASATLTTNLTDAPLSLFVDGAGGYLHLVAGAAAAIDQGTPGYCTDDIDGQARDAAPDIGADEYSDQ